MSSTAGPKHFGEYELKEILGRGAFGVVHRAVQISLRREVALKILNPPPAKLEDALLRFKREVELHCRLSHPNLVRILDAGFEGQHPYLAMELLEGPTLESMIRENRRLPARTAVPFGIAMAQALEYLHREGVLHRDMKTANVIIHQHKDLKVLDFGLARGAEDSALTRPGALVGTPTFMAPETFLKQGYSPASDAYAVGVVMYVALAGHLPFAIQSLEQHVKEKLSQAPTPLREIEPSVPQRVADAVMGLMAPDPADRMTLPDFRHMLTDPAHEPARHRPPAPLPATPPAGMARSPGAPTPPARPVPAGPPSGRGVVVSALAAVALGMAAWAALAPSRAVTRVTSSPFASPPPDTREPTSSERYARVREWHAKIHQDLPVLTATSTDGRYWIHLLVNLARATRAPVPSLNHVTKILSGPSTVKQRQDLLRILAESAGSGLAPDLAAASRLLAQEDPGLTPDDRWILLETLTALRLLDHALALSGAPEKVSGSDTWLGARVTPSLRFEPGERTGWFQVRAYLTVARYGKAGDGFDIIEGARKPAAEEQEVDLVTGTLQRDERHTHFLEETLLVRPLAPGDPRGETLEIGFWRVRGNPAQLFPQDLIWILLPGRRPLPLHAGLVNLPEEKAHGAVYMEQRLPPGSLGTEATVTVRVTREFLFKPEGPSPADVTIGVGWLRASRAVSP